MLIGLYERAVGLYASLIGINAYHQPGVEAGKKAATLFLGIKKKLTDYLTDHKGTFFTIEEIAANIHATGEEETLFKLLEHLVANPSKGIVKKAGNDPFSGSYARL